MQLNSRQLSHLQESETSLPTRSSEEGFGLVDCVLSMAVFSIAALGFLSVAGTSKGLQQENLAAKKATAVSREVLEQMRATDFRDVFATYNADPSDDPDGPGSATGTEFVIDNAIKKEYGGISKLSGKYGNELSGVVATTRPITCLVVFPTAIGLGGLPEVRENLNMPLLGLPADLNGDGVVDAANHAFDCLYLPVAVQTTWTDGTGQHCLVIHTVLSSK